MKNNYSIVNSSKYLERFGRKLQSLGIKEEQEKKNTFRCWKVFWENFGEGAADKDLIL